MKSLKPIDLSPGGSDRTHALAWGRIAAAVLILGIVLDSPGFKDFDPALVSAGAASKKVLGVDRSANPWSDIPKAKVILVAGANIAERTSLRQGGEWPVLPVSPWTVQSRGPADRWSSYAASATSAIGATR